MKLRVDSFQVVAAAILIICLTSACGKVRYPAYYILNFPQATAQSKASKQLPGAVLVREFQCPEYLCQGPILFRPSPEEVGHYEYHRWAVSPRIAITQFMVETLQEQSIFDYVSPYESGIAAAYSLKGRIERLEEVDSALDVKVECAISAELIDNKTGSIIWSDRASETLPVPQRNVKGVVNALTQASHTTVGNLVQSMMKKLASNP
jgi:ABC-type uncharacterized transport system auxiliary subunit